MYNGMIREITPLTVHDCFTIFSRVKSEFDFPLHHHEEMELNLILDAPGAKRIVGDHMEDITDKELVFVSSNLPHGWFMHNCTSTEIREFTIQFHKDLIDEKFLRRNQLSQIRKMFEQAKQGILFTREAVEEITPRILALVDKRGFGSILELLSILHALSNSKNYRTLSDASFTNENYNFNSRRIEKVFEYMNSNFHKLISLADVAKIANMPEASFSRFIKKRTGYSFIDSLNEIRLGHVSRMLIDTTHSVSEIAFKCGFNNMANFNRTFKNKKGCTPKEFRESYLGTRVFV
ncbi:AraC family transcriptional regulator [Pedobacter yulinensis]|uniref:AraC family transcriptional regulator n=2 Tax=Pedobacter yulinensis TaxID=2126353 RepID=A0A2T3HMU6_9SPHI|nr:AraC family transcriptional regulator [Pedobacter yulinensis]